VNVIFVGLYGKEEEGIDTASDVVKVKGEDQATPGCLSEDRVRRFAGYSEP